MYICCEDLVLGGQLQHPVQEVVAHLLDTGLGLQLLKNIDIDNLLYE